MEKVDEKMNVEEKAVEILKNQFVCNHCLGRSFGQLLTGMTNEERGKILRHYLAMLIDSGKKISVNESNFYGIKFHNVKVKPKKPKKCSICGSIFQELEKKARIIVKKLKKYEFNTFLVGCKLTPELIRKEEDLWSRVGIEWCESIKCEINRELGKKVCELTGKDMNRKTPDITILYDLNTDEVELDVRSIYIYGKYQKLVRGIPQTEWKRRIYKTSVQGIIEKPFLKQTKVKKTCFHGSGREDVNVRCLGWRPFVLEIVNPIKRTLNLREARETINKSKKVKVKDLKIVGKYFVRKIKSAKYDKTYRAKVVFERPVEGLEKLKQLKDVIIFQKTPKRVLRRRADKTRRRKVKDIKYKLLDKNKVELKITTQAGMYVKELITGDEGRTQPNISGLINNKVKSIELDVIKIWD